MSDNNENVIEFLKNQQTATVCFSQQRFVNRITELAKNYPQVCVIKDINNDGSIVAHIPVEWVKIRPPRQMTEEQRVELADRINRVRCEYQASKESNSHENTSDDKIST